MGLAEDVAAAFAQQGAVAQSQSHYKPRAGQIAMARAVAATVEKGGQLVVEAGTGVGKTFAYLVPVLLSGRRAMVSTATKALQDQLALRDIPRLLETLKLQARVSVLKGRASYLCLNRLESAWQHPDALSAVGQRHLAELERWATHTPSGDLAEMQGWPDQTPLEPLVTSTRDNCLGSTCPQVATCFVNRARARAMAADLVVVNHHLFFADMNVRESGVAELLPFTQVVVFDEAHQLNDIGVQFLGRQWTTRQVEALCRDLNKYATSLSLGSPRWRDWMAELLRATVDLKAMTAGAGAGAHQTLSWSDNVPQGLDVCVWSVCVQAIATPLQQLLVLLQMLQETDPGLQLLAERTGRCLEEFEFFNTPVFSHQLRWLECSSHVKLCCSPLDISKAMATHMAELLPDGATQRAWIFTSATLGTDAELALFRGHCGLEGSQILRVESPFDYAAQAALFIPTDFPLPSDPMHSLEVAHLAAQAARVLGGRTMVLTTSLRAMHAIGLSLHQQFAITGGLEVLVQGAMSKREILSRVSSLPDDGQNGLVLVASMSFWEGVDIPGDALQLVIIDKIPFLSPDGALTQAREAQLLSRGQNPFRMFHLPHAALGLKQGAGRLIRSETDRGILVICDPRLTSKSYGKKIISALPPMRRIPGPDDFQSELNALTRSATTEPSWF